MEAYDEETEQLSSSVQKAKAWLINKSGNGLPSNVEKFSKAISFLCKIRTPHDPTSLMEKLQTLGIIHIDEAQSLVYSTHIPVPVPQQDPLLQRVVIWINHLNAQYRPKTTQQLIICLRDISVNKLELDPLRILDNLVQEQWISIQEEGTLAYNIRSLEKHDSIRLFVNRVIARNRLYFPQSSEQFLANIQKLCAQHQYSPLDVLQYALDNGLLKTKVRGILTDRKEDGLDDLGWNQECCLSFDKMRLSEAIRSSYFQHPSKIQQLIIKPILQMKNVIAQAPPGTGKTAAYLIPLIEKFIAEPRREDSKFPRCLILTASRELVLQVEQEASMLATISNVRFCSLCGGYSVGEDIRSLEKGVDIVVGVVGRVLDMIKRKKLRTKDLRTIVFDEVDDLVENRMSEVAEIFQYVPKHIQVVCTSSTIWNTTLAAIHQLPANWDNSAKFLLDRDQLFHQQTKHFCINVEYEQWKLDTLCDLYDTLTITQALIFVNTKIKASWLAEKLQKKNFPSQVFHGDNPQTEREEVLKAFRQGQSRVLITTDILARGFDVSAVSLVVNYDIPNDRGMYLHRSGRCGRYGRKGVVISLCKHDDLQILLDTAQFFSLQIDEVPSNVADLI